MAEDDLPESDRPAASGEQSDQLIPDTPAADAPLPPAVIDDAERLMRLARQAVDDAEAAAYRTDVESTLAEHDYTARVREEEDGDVLVLHPADWLSGDTIDIEAIDDVDDAVERRLSGVGDTTEFDRVDAHNRATVEEVESMAGSVHAANASAFADFMGNYYVRRVETATNGEVIEFLEEYFPRNAFPTAAQEEVIEESLRLVFDISGRELPPCLGKNGD